MKFNYLKKEVYYGCFVNFFGTNPVHMELKYEIVLQLAKEESHLRELANKLNVNHMSVSRALKVLIVENSVDYKEKGKYLNH